MAETGTTEAGAPTWVWLAAVAGAVGLVGLFAVQVLVDDQEGVRGIAVTTAIVLVAWVATLRLSAHEPELVVRRVVQAGFWLHLLAAAAFHALVFRGPGGDAARYHEAGVEIAGAIRDGDWVVLADRGLGGTAMMENLAGLLYAATGPSSLTGFAVFALLGFLGSYLVHRAFVRAVPNGDHGLYAVLVFLLPSMLFWPASLGKEAWMVVSLGVSVWGAARVLDGRRGVLILLAGVAGQALLRPHMAAMTLVALAAATVVRHPWRDSPTRRRGRAVLLVVVLAGGAAAATVVQQAFGLGSLGPGTITGFLDTIADNTSIGGSAFSNVETVNPLLAPVAFVSVLFRPFPHEATSALMLLASLESLLVAGLLVARRRSLRNALGLLRSNGYVAFAGTYTLLFVLAYSFFNNLGLLVRERVQLLPVLFVLVAVGGRWTTRRTQPRPDAAAEPHSTVPAILPPARRTR